MLWNEDNCLNILIGQHPMSPINFKNILVCLTVLQFSVHEALSMSKIYCKNRSEVVNGDAVTPSDKRGTTQIEC